MAAPLHVIVENGTADIRSRAFPSIASIALSIAFAIIVFVGFTIVCGIFKPHTSQTQIDWLCRARWIGFAWSGIEIPTRCMWSWAKRGTIYATADENAVRLPRTNQSYSRDLVYGVASISGWNRVPGPDDARAGFHALVLAVHDEHSTRPEVQVVELVNNPGMIQGPRLRKGWATKANLKDLGRFNVGSTKLTSRAELWRKARIQITDALLTASDEIT